MTKIEALSLEQAYKDAAETLECSVTELNIEVVQSPSNGIFGLFKKSAIIIAVKKAFKEVNSESSSESNQGSKVNGREASRLDSSLDSSLKSKKETSTKTHKPEKAKIKKEATNKKTEKQKNEHKVLNDTIMPQSFVSTQDDEDYDMSDINFTADYEDETEDTVQEEFVSSQNLNDIAAEVAKDINILFDLTCFEIDAVDVSVYDENTLLVEFKGKDAALLIGKEGYRYKALSYMIFNWINTKYQLQLRLEIAEFLKNQEEAVSRYLTGVYESVDRDGRCQTKILDGVLIQIALRELRAKYADKYVAIRSTRDGLKYIIINDYHSN